MNQCEWRPRRSPGLRVTGQPAVENHHISPIVVDAVLGVIADNGVGDCQITR